MAREMALQMLYQRDLGGRDPEEILSSFELDERLAPSRGEGEEDEEARPGPGAGRGRAKRTREAFEHARELVRGTCEALEEIDALIRRQAENWRLERMPPVDRNILRLAVFELLHEREVPRLVVVDEAIELAKRYGSEQSGRFVNGVLDGLLKEVLTGDQAR